MRKMDLFCEILVWVLMFICCSNIQLTSLLNTTYIACRYLYIQEHKYNVCVFASFRISWISLPFYLIRLNSEVVGAINIETALGFTAFIPYIWNVLLLHGYFVSLLTKQELAKLPINVAPVGCHSIVWYNINVYCV